MEVTEKREAYLHERRDWFRKEYGMGDHAAAHAVASEEASGDYIRRGLSFPLSVWIQTPDRMICGLVPTETPEAYHDAMVMIMTTALVTQAVSVAMVGETTEHFPDGGEGVCALIEEVGHYWRGFAPLIKPEKDTENPFLGLWEWVEDDEPRNGPFLFANQANIRG